MGAVIIVLVIAGLALVVVGGVILFVGALEAAAVLVAIAIVVFAVAFIIDAFRTPPPTCGLVRRAVLRDTCEGTCPPGQLCAPTTTRPYGRIGFLGVQFGVQAATCACVAVAAPGGPPGSAAPSPPGDTAPSPPGDTAPSPPGDAAPGPPGGGAPGPGSEGENG